jgi:hypothetical protein
MKFVITFGQGQKSRIDKTKSIKMLINWNRINILGVKQLSCCSNSRKQKKIQSFVENVTNKLTQND